MRGHRPDRRRLGMQRQLAVGLGQGTVLARDLPEFSSMQEDGLLKAMSGFTSLAEVIANAPRDTDPRPMSVLRGISSSWRAS